MVQRRTPATPAHPLRGGTPLPHRHRGGPPLCVDPATHRTTHTGVLAPGDTLLHYTDGLIETPASSFDEGQQRLKRAATRHRGEPLPELLGNLQDLSEARDDIAMIAFRADPTR
ncbi:SpoIIE family protein phosphatase [Kitasatospora phosalacinea]|uniref:SpoIIE family protein phosphatase n=1 Tax=Kitasatospora phosalacinea TaxID=2065 RepID=UPI003323BE1F